MKKTTILSMIAIIAIFLSSCGSGKVLKKPLAIKPLKTNIVNKTSDVFTQDMINESLSEFINIIDGTYSIVPINDSKDWRIDVKFNTIKKANKDDEFEISSTGYTPGGTGLYLVDNAGTIIEEWGGVGEFDLVNKDVLIDYLKSGEGECMLRFENDAYKFEKYLETPEEIAGFIIKTSAYRKTAKNTRVQSNETSYSNDDEEIVEKKSGSTNWDKVLADYEAYTDKYIKLLKKANAGDASALSEYMEMLEKAQEFQESLEDADDDLTPAQLQKFNKINMKLMNAASGL